MPALHQSLCVSLPPHARSQPPQRAGSLSGLTHWPSQQIVPEAQAGVVQFPETHAPLMQTCDAPQALPQPPQFALSKSVLTHLFEHSVNPTEAQLTQLALPGPVDWQ